MKTCRASSRLMSTYETWMQVLHLKTTEVQRVICQAYLNGYKSIYKETEQYPLCLWHILHMANRDADKKTQYQKKRQIWKKNKDKSISNNFKCMQTNCHFLFERAEFSLDLTRIGCDAFKASYMKRYMKQAISSTTATLALVEFQRLRSNYVCQNWPTYFM